MNHMKDRPKQTRKSEKDLQNLSHRYTVEGRCIEILKFLYEYESE